MAKQLSKESGGAISRNDVKGSLLALTDRKPKGVIAPDSLYLLLKNN